ncbi:MAG: hypothetical protein HYW49_04885 [Deltaproteobacteria bacterium]|nr:hypothetical protein [Deltaproteobacteria bacterium]
MYSRRFLAVLVLAGSLGACGVLGQKDDVQRLLEYKSDSAGCLNEFGPNVRKFMEGTISEDAWTKSWDCTLDSLDLFQQFVKGSTEEGYSQEDIHNFVSRFLVTDKPVSRELISASFALKASLFGGNRGLLARAELKRFVELLKLSKKASTELIPHLRNRAKNPGAKNLAELSDAIEKFGSVIAEAFTYTTENEPLMQSDAQRMLDELALLYGWPVSRDWTGPVMSGKVLLMAGAQDRIEGRLWPQFFRAIGALGGAAVAAASAKPDKMKGPNEYGGFLVRMGAKVKKVLEAAVDTNEGVIAFSKIDQFLDAIPTPTDPESGLVWLVKNRDGVKKGIRPAVRKLLWSSVMTGVDRKSLNIAYALAETWNRGQTHLERIFEQYKFDPGGVSETQFAGAASDYKKDLDALGKEDVDRLITIARKYQPMFLGNDSEITFSPTIRNSLGNLTKFHWMNLASRHLLQSYASLAAKSKATVDDVHHIIEDFRPAMVAIKFLDPTLKDVHIKRAREADMFMFSSNGDGLLDEDEVTYYLAVMVSSGVMSGRIRKVIEPLCGGSSLDPLDWRWMDPACWRREFFSRSKIFWDHFPLMVEYYDTMPEDLRERMHISLEKAARRYGYTELPIGGVDNVSFPAVMHYIETLFMRYDKGVRDQKLDVHEALTAYPNFKMILAKLDDKVDPEDDATLRAAFTYTVKFGKPPETKSIGGIAHFLWWKSWRPLWKIDATRGSIYDILPIVAGSDTPPPGTVPGNP